MFENHLIKKYDKKLPLVSVVTVVYNAQNYLEETIQSVLNQTYPNIEYVIVDGGSTDSTLGIIKKYESEIDYWISEPDEGIYDAMNKGILLARGEWINFLNAGDRFISEDTVERVMKKSSYNYDMLYGNSVITNNDGIFLKELKALSFTRLNLVVMGTRTVCHQAVFIRKSKICFYDNKFTLKGELKWYFELLEHNKNFVAYKLDIPIVYYRLGGKGESKRWSNLKEKIQVLYIKGGVVYVLLSLPLIIYGILIYLVRNLKYDKKKVSNV